MTVSQRGDEFPLEDQTAYGEDSPLEFLCELQETDPVHWHPAQGEFAPGFWVVTRYDDVVTVSREARTFRSGDGFLMEKMLPGLENLIINQDPPEHTRNRMLVARAFTPKVVRSMEGSVRRATTEIIDRALEMGEFDFVKDVAAELPLMVIADLIGVPREDRHKVFDWSNTMMGRYDPEYGGEEAIAAMEAADNAAAELFAYAQTMADDHLANPRDDLVTKLLTPDENGDMLTAEEYNYFVLLLAVAGNETTRNLISGGMQTLFDHPDQRERVAQDRSLIPSAVEEMLRFVSPVRYFRRTAAEDTKIGDVPVAQGDHVTIWYGAANRDPRHFEDPHTFDVTREPNEHLAFGGRGPHYCLGASLARMEINVMFEEIFERMPDLQPTAPASRLASSLINGIKHIPVKV
ncbi:MAG: cytochrome P450 [Acidimicrobiia bacterium]|nr:cytochrome P450 [Acidimicrobiia bacterium]